MVSEWSDIFELLGLALNKTEEHLGRGKALGTELDGRQLSSRVTSKRFWMMRQGLTELESVIGWTLATSRKLESRNRRVGAV